MPSLMRACLCYRSRARRALRSSPTRRSSDLERAETDEPAADAPDKVRMQVRVLLLQLLHVCWQLQVSRPKLELIWRFDRSEEHTSELQSPCNVVCRLLLEKKKEEGRYASAGD